MDDTRKPVGRGGKRAGAGRKKKLRAATVIDDADLRLLVAEAAPDHVETAAQRHARTAIGALVKKMIGGVSEAARVAAANAILDRGYGKPTVEVGGDAFLPFASAPTAVTISPEMRNEARKYAMLAIEVLRRVAEFGQSDAAVVTASKSILDRALGAVGPAKVPEELGRATLGKREQAAEDAREAATGIFAPPAPPDEETKH